MVPDSFGTGWEFFKLGTTAWSMPERWVKKGFLFQCPCQPEE